MWLAMAALCARRRPPGSSQTGRASKGKAPVALSAAKSVGRPSTGGVPWPTTSSWYSTRLSARRRRMSSARPRPAKSMSVGLDMPFTVAGRAVVRSWRFASGPHETQREAVARAAPLARGTWGRVPVACVGRVAQEIPGGGELEPGALNLVAHGALVDAVERLDITGPRAGYRSSR